MITTHASSTAHRIKDGGLAPQGFISPPLSHNSDITFLEWKRACREDNKNINSLQRLFLTTIQSESTRAIVKHIFATRGNPLKRWGDLPVWKNRIRFPRESSEAAALLATPQVKSIAWMLMQHRAELGMKYIKYISVFKDDNAGTDEEKYPDFWWGPTLYVELADMP